MHVSRSWLPLCVLLAAGAIVAGAASEAPPAVGADDTTTVRGTIPPVVVGRWLIVAPATPAARPAAPPTASGAAPLEMTQTGSGEVALVRTWEVRRDGERFAMSVHRGQLAEPLRKRVARSGQPAGERAPDAAVLAEVAAQWSSLATSIAEPRVIRSEFLDAAGVREDETRRPGTPGALFFIQTSEEYTPGTGLLRSTTVYAVTTAEPDRLAGRFAGAMVLPPQQRGAVALPPVPVGLQGEFVAYRIPEHPRSVLGRLLGVFSGCGRR